MKNAIIKWEAASPTLLHRTLLVEANCLLFIPFAQITHDIVLILVFRV